MVSRVQAWRDCSPTDHSTPRSTPARRSSGATRCSIPRRSARGTAGPGNRTLIAGFVIRGSAPRTLLVRAAGSGLASFNVAGTVADPAFMIVDARGATIASNDDWSAAANQAEVASAALKVGAFAFAPGSKDAALLVTLAPGNYTALVSGAGNSSGLALVEVYDVP